MGRETLILKLQLLDTYCFHIDTKKSKAEIPKCWEDFCVSETHRCYPLCIQSGHSQKTQLWMQQLWVKPEVISPSVLQV